MPNGGQLKVSAWLQGKKLSLRISDTGKGLAKEEVSQIFNPYFTTKKTGTGLGLAIVQKIVEAHGGSIEVEKTGGSGTTFLLSIPVERARGVTS
jgi:two-component system sensor histidine kinase HydH